MYINNRKKKIKNLIKVKTNLLSIILTYRNILEINSTIVYC